MEGVEKVDVDFEAKTATVTARADVDPEQVADALTGQYKARVVAN